MKVLMLNGSPKARGNTGLALEEIGRQLEREGIEYEIFQIGGGPVRDCIGCGRCTDDGCVFTDDGVNAFIAKAREADGFVFGTPVYYAHPSGRILSFLDRVFFSSGEIFAFKPGAAVAIARRGGTTASFDVMNKYFGISQMPVAGSTGTSATDGHPARSPRMRRACAPCAIWPEAWPGCSNASRPEKPRAWPCLTPSRVR